jgi:hypothetical protein
MFRNFLWSIITLLWSALQFATTDALGAKFSVPPVVRRAAQHGGRREAAAAARALPLPPFVG